MSESGKGSRQRLAAILAADAVGYSRLMAVDEHATMAALDAAREVFRSQIEAQQGRVIDMAGDSVLAIFETATGAVSSALAIQTQLETLAAGVPADRRMRFRIGVHLGDVDRALALEPTLVPALQLAFWQVHRLNDVDPRPDHEGYVRKADQSTARAVTLDPDNSHAWDERAVALELLGRWSASLEASQRSIDLDPYGPRAYLMRAWLLTMMGRPAEALQLADKALLLDPSSQSWSLSFACQAHLLLGEADKAIASCERASGLARNFVHHSFLAAAYSNAGDIEHARVALRAMLEMVPGYTIEQLKAKRYSDHPEYQKIAERYWYDGLRKAGLAEK